MKNFSSSVLRLVLVLAVGGLAQLEAAQPKNGYTVTVDIHADEEGRPQNVSVVESNDSNPGDVLVKMAVAMAMDMKLPPKLKDGKPVKFTARAPFFFPIEDDEGPGADEAPKPKVKEAIQPVYPQALRADGVAGGVILELIVDTRGNLAKLTTLRASHPEFEAAARDAVQKWSFTAAQKDGQAVESRTRLAVVFETEEKMADVKWRIPPRPKLGSMTVIRPSPESLEQAAAAENAPASAPAEATKK